MTLPEIAFELENLIQRLQTARTLLASLGPEADLSLPLSAAAVTQQPRLTRKRLFRPSAAAGMTTLTMEQGAEAELAVAPEARPEGPVATTRPVAAARSHHRPANTVPASLAGKVPSGPVAVPASEIRRRFTPAPAPEPVAEPARGNSLDDLLRELAHRPLGGVTL